MCIFIMLSAEKDIFKSYPFFGVHKLFDVRPPKFRKFTDCSQVRQEMATTGALNDFFWVLAWLMSWYSCCLRCLAVQLGKIRLLKGFKIDTLNIKTEFYIPSEWGTYEKTSQTNCAKINKGNQSFKNFVLLDNSIIRI